MQTRNFIDKKIKKTINFAGIIINLNNIIRNLTGVQAR